MSDAAYQLDDAKDLVKGFVIGAGVVFALGLVYVVITLL